MNTLVSPSGYDYNPKVRYRSEVDWGPPPRPPPVQPPSWHCGDLERRRALVERFGQVSSVHGTLYICSRKKVSKGAKIFYRCLFYTSMVMVVANVAMVLQTAWGSESSYMNNISKKSSLGRDEDPDHFPIFPKVTLCRRPPYRTDFNASYQELVEYVTLALGYPFVNWTPEEVSYLLFILNRRVTNEYGVKSLPEAEDFYSRLQDLEVRFKELKNLDPYFDIKKFIMNHSMSCEEIFSSCQAFVFSLNCCQLFRPVLTSLGLCYTLQDTDPIEELQKSIPIKFALNLDLYSPETVEKTTETGFQVFLTDPSEETYMFNDHEGQKVVPGLVTTISVQLIKTDRQELHSTWYGIPQCPKSPYGDMSERYTPITCKAHSAFQILQDTCGCDSILTHEPYPALRPCDPSDQYDCFIFENLKNNLSDIADKCPNPCVLYTFRNVVSYMGLGGENISRVEIVYNSDHYIFHEFRTFTFTGLFSQIGGVLGLYLGASIITVVEIIYFIISWLWYTCLPTKLSRTHPTSHDEPYSIRLTS